MLKLTSLTCEYEKNPLGIDTQKPRFSWIIESDGNNIMQSAYEIIVDGMWQSGKVESDNSVCVEYAGKPLQPCTKYNYKVRIYTTDGNVSDWCDASFETGVMGNWCAEWIMADEQDGSFVSPRFRKDFKPEKKISSARIYATAMGLYEIYINGSKVGDIELAPGFTSYEKHIQYQTYDVTKLLSDDNNAIGIMLGKGWARGRVGWGDRPESAYSKLMLSAMLQMRVCYEDGTEEIIKTDSSWKCSKESQILFSGIYDGEAYDARLEENWCNSSFDASSWDNALVFDYTKSVVKPQHNEPCRVIDVVKPIEMIKTPKGETVIDFGQNLVGRLCFTLKGNAGDKIVIKHAEILDKDGNFYTGNLRTAKEQIDYTFKGGDAESYKPRFTFMGFRYISIIGYKGQFDMNDFSAEVIHSDVERTGYYECSDKMVNQLFSNIIWGQKGNFVDVPTDCPQRDERLGWTGDAQVFVRTAAFNMNVKKFFEKWLYDMSLDQKESGIIPKVIPDVLYEDDSSSAWGDASVICPWEIFRAFGDKTVLENQYECMKKWVEYIHGEGDSEYLWNTGFHYGDWLGLDAREGDYTGATSRDLIATAYFAYSTNILAKTARVLGNQADADKYDELYKKVVESFNNEFITPNGRLTDGTQTALALALYFDLAPDKKRLANELAQLVKENGNKLKTGFVGTPYICHALSENGFADVAYDLLIQREYPSWLYPITKGATTMWEHWDGVKPDGSFWSSDMNSYNHYAYGAVADWMFGVSAGISVDENNPGYKKIKLAPVPTDKLDYVKASVKTMYGTVSSEWKNENGKIKYKFAVPHNTTAEITIDGKTQTVGSGVYEF